jgi:16S rRNA (uracil1498-N3)-methyltransferase
MRAYYNLQRLYTKAPLILNEAIETTPEQFNYLAHVLRLADHAEILIFNGMDGEFKARLAFLGKKKLLITPFEQTRAQSDPYQLMLLFAPLKVGRLDYLVQKAVEMGAGIIQPVLTHHTQNHRISVEKLRANSVEACEQCGILTIPQICEPVKLEILLQNWSNNRHIIFCDEDVQARELTHTLTALKGKDLGVLIGPEGGFSDRERDLLRALPFVTPLALGPRILRADTAVVAALAVVQALIGDWQYWQY